MSSAPMPDDGGVGKVYAGGQWEADGGFSTLSQRCFHKRASGHKRPGSMLSAPADGVHRGHSCGPPGGVEPAEDAEGGAEGNREENEEQAGVELGSFAERAVDDLDGDPATDRAEEPADDAEDGAFERDQRHHVLP